MRASDRGKPPESNRAIVAKAFGIGLMGSLVVTAMTSSGEPGWGILHLFAVVIGAVLIGGSILFMRGTKWTPVLEETDTKTEFLKRAACALRDPPEKQLGTDDRGKGESGIRP